MQRRLRASFGYGILKKTADREDGAMTIRDEKQLRQELLQCEDTMQWYQKILDNPGVSQSAKDAAKDMLRQAEKARREILSKLQG